MSEQGKNEQRAGLEQSDEIVRLLESPNVQTGLSEAKSAMERHYATLKKAGNAVSPILEGITPDGTCLTVAEYHNASEPAAGEGRQYAVFTYSLNEVTSPDFAANLAPRQLGVFNDHIIEVETPADPMLISKDDIVRAEHEGLNQSDPAAFDELYTTYFNWMERNSIVLGEPSSGQAWYGEQEIMPFEKAAFGARREAAVSREVGPLHAKEEEERQKAELAKQFRDAQAAAVHEAAAEELAARARQIIKNMHESPTMVDQSGVVHDPAKAERMAYAMKDSMDRGRVSKANRQGDKAAAEYDADPLGASMKPVRKGLFSRFRRR